MRQAATAIRDWAGGKALDSFTKNMIIDERKRVQEKIAFCSDKSKFMAKLRTDENPRGIIHPSETES